MRPCPFLAPPPAITQRGPASFRLRHWQCALGTPRPHYLNVQSGLSPSSSGCVPRSSAGGSGPPETQSRPAVDRRRDTPTLTPPANTRRASPSFAPASLLEMAAAGWLTASPTNENATPQSTLATGGGDFLCLQVGVLLSKEPSGEFNHPEEF